MSNQTTSAAPQGGDNLKKGGMGCLTILFVILFIVKIAGVAAISWWWVFSPIYVPMAIMLIVALLP